MQHVFLTFSGKTRRFAFSRLTYLLLPLIYFMLVTITGCDTPEKVLKSDDVGYKKAKVTEWYNKKEYVKCIPVLEELIGQLKAREPVEELYYMYCMSNYKQGDYMISAYHFKYFYDQYPNHARAEECLFMYAKSFQKLSPKAELDQTYTLKGLEAYQYFLSMYPDSKYVPECNEAVSDLHRKLEKKALGSAELYYKTSNFKAAATSYENLLKDYPDIAEIERVSFMITKANFKLAENSVPQRKTERYKRVILTFADFKSKYPNSKFIEEGERYVLTSHYQAARSAFEWAEISPLDEREKTFNGAFAEARLQAPYITDARQKKEMADLTEKGYFLIVKSYFLRSQTAREGQKPNLLNKTVKTYYNFVDLFPKSKYIKEAEKIFNNATEQIKKLKPDGQS